MDDRKKGTTFSIRRATTSDIEAIAGLLAYVDEFHQPHDRRQIRQGPPQRADKVQLAKGIVDPATLVLVGQIEGTVVGYARMEIKDTKGNRLFNPMRLAIVHEVIVAKRKDRNGVGTALMETVHTEARSAGAKRIQLEHYAANATARRFYVKHGYSILRFVCVKDL
jgi:ribosomal protein S18 acetylase RimI-like enzyme